MSMTVTPSEVKLFTGANFKLDLGKSTVKELRAALQQMDRELSLWGDDREIEIIDVHRERGIDVSLVEPIWP